MKDYYWLIGIALVLVIFGIPGLIMLFIAVMIIGAFTDTGSGGGHNIDGMDPRDHGDYDDM